MPARVRWTSESAIIRWSTSANHVTPAESGLGRE